MSNIDSLKYQLQLNKVWNKLDVDKRGFIYGEDLPKFINEMCQLTQAGTSRLDSSKWDTINAFANEKKYVKVYKIVIDEFLNNLIGISFNKFLNDGVLRKENEKQDSIQKPITNPAEIDKDEIIKAKELELSRLTKEATLYREKYELLQREFKFYKKHYENSKMKMTDSNEPEIIEPANKSINHDFIIKEFKRQILEQSQIINKLRDQIRYHDGSINNYNTSDSTTIKTRKKFLNQDKLFFNLVIISLLTILLFTIVRKTLFYTIAEETTDLYDQSSSSIISQLLTHFFATNNNDKNYHEMTDEDVDAYNKIFGLQS